VVIDKPKSLAKSALRDAFETQAIRLASFSATPRDIDELYHLAELIDARAPVVNEPSEGPDREALLEDWQFHKHTEALLSTIACSNFRLDREPAAKRVPTLAARV
jgi:hypothetical protein